MGIYYAVISVLVLVIIGLIYLMKVKFKQLNDDLMDFAEGVALSDEISEDNRIDENYRVMKGTMDIMADLYRRGYSFEDAIIEMNNDYNASMRIRMMQKQNGK